MGIFAIADLHLPGGQGKTMELFGQQWANHAERIAAAWRETITDDDHVLMPGDHSWAMRLDEAISDLQWIASLPGRKYIGKGNHDYWWDRDGPLSKVLPDSLSLVTHNYAHLLDGLAVAGTRGWSSPPFPESGEEPLHGEPDRLSWEQHERIYQREIGRLRISLERMDSESDKRIALLHFPPFNHFGGATDFSDLLHEFGIDICLYGHLHGRAARGRWEGDVHGIEYYCVACDVVNFRPVRIV